MKSNLNLGQLVTGPTATTKKRSKSIKLKRSIRPQKSLLEAKSLRRPNIVSVIKKCAEK